MSLDIVKYITESQWISKDTEVVNPHIDKARFYPSEGDIFDFKDGVAAEKVEFGRYTVEGENFSKEVIELPRGTRFVRMRITQENPELGYNEKYKAALENTRFFEIGNVLVGEPTKARPFLETTNVISRYEHEGKEFMMMESNWSDTGHGEYICPRNEPPADTSPEW